ncbi:response regulator transcription factor [Streptomyces sp. enrichment culture]|uniref:helix-turn-helix transcriptional regulator n=1 Tax=Streptomyces sp. enrichment culture TaxID=1795815 RepID=UPI003F57AB26
MIATTVSPPTTLPAPTAPTTRSAPTVTVPRPGVRVRVRSNDATARAVVEARLITAGLRPTEAPDPSPQDVLVAVGGTVEAAIEVVRPGLPGEYGRLLVVADVLSRHGALRALRAGARAMVLSAEATPERLAATVHSAHRGEGRLSHLALARLLDESPEPSGSGRRPDVPALTGRQLQVLRLMADGHGNEAIAATLRCSKHTVKNVIYELMGQLQVRNRAHAVAHAVRTGLI